MIVVGDSLETLRVMGCREFKPSNMALYQRIKYLNTRRLEVQLWHTYREANAAANYMANLMYGMALELYFFDEAPRSTEMILQQDLARRAWER